MPRVVTKKRCQARKGIVLPAVLLVVALLAFWSGSPVRPEFAKFVLFTAVFFVVAMWIFPEAGGKKGGAGKR